MCLYELFRFQKLVVYTTMYAYLYMHTGHSDVVMGAICTNDDELGSKLKYFANGMSCYCSVATLS